VKKKITIGGIGSVLLGDDGVGPYVVRLLEANYEFGEGITVSDLGTPGLDLVAHLSGQDALILIDSVDNGASPGTVTLYRRADILKHGPSPVRMDPHSPALSESLLIAELAGQNPDEVLLVGITGHRYEVGTSLSHAARRAATQALAETLAEVARLGGHYRKRSNPQDSSTWWEATEANDSTALLLTNS